MLCGRSCNSFLPVECCPKSIKTTLIRIFSCAMLSGAFWATLHKAVPVKFCPKSIKTTLKKIFPCVILSRVFWATLHKVFTCGILFQENYDNN